MRLKELGELKRLSAIILLILFLVGCSSVDVNDMFEITRNDSMDDDTLNMYIATAEEYKEKDLKKIADEVGASQDWDKVNGVRIWFTDSEGIGYAKAIMSFNKDGAYATGTKKVRVAEITID